MIALAFQVFALLAACLGWDVSTASSAVPPSVASHAAEWAGVVATLLAVLVALFGPKLWAWHARPRVGVAAEGLELLVEDPQDDSVTSAQIVLSNEVGKDTALDVEVTLTAWCEIDYLSKILKKKIVAPIVQDRSLIFDSGGRDGALKVSIPPGGVRRVEFVHLARAAALDGLLEDRRAGAVDDGITALGAFAVAPSAGPSERRTWIQQGKPHTIEIVVHGTNIDASLYRGTITLNLEHRPEFPTPEKHLHTLAWDPPLHRVPLSSRLGSASGSRDQEDGRQLHA